ncbi:hypothetical protein O6P43_018548 [Quillaja saponaria]|uniref:Uncharacterized protein n=1 Tax=Quillaja saponaria TaxID=32244 RepID=A0AAD7PQI2_QUISA|nr:hypothetical protein O6P43_018548 [Quillaja saponaria]
MAVSQKLHWIWRGRSSLFLSDPLLGLSIRERTELCSFERRGRQNSDSRRYCSPQNASKRRAISQETRRVRRSSNPVSGLMLTEAYAPPLLLDSLTLFGNLIYQFP